MRGCSARDAISRTLNLAGTQRFIERRHRLLWRSWCSDGSRLSRKRTCPLTDDTVTTGRTVLIALDMPSLTLQAAVPGLAMCPAELGISGAGAGTGTGTGTGGPRRHRKYIDEVGGVRVRVGVVRGRKELFSISRHKSWFVCLSWLVLVCFCSK